MISIIIPVYNAKQYICSCIDGVLRQTYLPKEILLINDGSTDGSGELCEEYAQKEAKIRAYHTANGGAAHARNVGLDHATGDFIVFLDADDKIPENHLHILMETQKKYNADMVSASVTYVPGPTICQANNVLTTWEFIEKVLYRDGVGDYPISKLYRRSMFDGLRFVEGITSEDFEIFYRLYKRAKTIATTNETTYYYIQHSNSVSNCGFSEKFFNRITICEQLEKQIEQENPKLLAAVHSRIVDEATWLAGILPKGYPEQKAWIKNNLKKYCAEVLQNPKVTAKVKRKTILCMLMPWLYSYRGQIKASIISLMNIKEDMGA